LGQEAHVTDTVGDIRAWAAERRLPEKHLERWLAMGGADRCALLRVARALRLSTGAMVTALTMLQEIATRERCSIELILARDPIARAIKGSGSAPARASAFLAVLKAMRYPRLTEAARRLEAAIAQLGLPRGITISLPKDLNSDQIRIELEARDGAELKRLIEALHLSRAQLTALVDSIGGGGEDEPVGE
jgi:hypothetical protein